MLHPELVKESYCAWNSEVPLARLKLEGLKINFRKQVLGPFDKGTILSAP